MVKYDPKKFVNELSKQMNGRGFPNCPYCGGNKFTSTDKFSSIIIGDDLGSINIGPSVPAGMVICEKCGHIEFFALGVLGLLNRAEDEENGK